MSRIRNKQDSSRVISPARSLARPVQKAVPAIIERLEERQFLSADPGVTGQAISPAAVGVNLNVNEYYRTQALWVNAALTLNAWAKFNDPATPNPNLTYTSDGYPKQSASTWTQLKGYPDGIYKLSYTGQATISISSMGQIIGTPVTVNNVTTADVQVTHANGSNLIIGVSGLDQTGANPFGNLKLIMPGYAVNTTQIVNASTAQRLGAFGTIRSMDLQYININTEANWAERVQPNAFLQTGSHGVAYEDIIALANASHDNLWINIPVNATNDYVDQLAKLVRDTLDPSLKVHVEYGNELWHNGFYSGQTNYANAQANTFLTSSYGNGRAGQQQAFKLKTFHDIWVQEFNPLGNNPAAEARFGFVFAGHPDVNDRFNTEAFSFIQQKYGSASFLEAYSRAMYLNITDAQDVDGITTDQLFTALESDLPALSTEIVASKAFANQYGLKFFIYEGGQGVTGSDFRNLSVKIAAQSDPRMGVIYQRMYDLVALDGVDLFMHYGYSDASTQYGSWGLLESADTAGAVKWDQTLNNVLKRGDDNLDHVVDYADFLVLKASFDQTQQPGYVDKDMFWQQGDFNQDRRVTAADYYLWKANATNLTSDQATAVAAFEASLPSATVTKPVVTVLATDAVASEPVSGAPADTGLLTFTRTGGDVNQSLTINLSFLSGTATYGTDYLTNTGTTTLTFVAGASTATLLLTAVGDNVLESNETAVVTVYARSGYTLGTATSAAVTINDVTVPGTPLKLSGTVIGTAGSYQNNGNTKEKAFDGNTVTTYDGSGPDGNWVGLDLGTAKTITSIRYAPRINWTTRMNGGRFQASNNIGFLTTGTTNGVANTVTNLTPLPLSGTVAGWNSVSVSDLNGYQFVRYSSPNGSYGDVAELEFYGVTPADTTPPTVPGTPALVSKTDNSITLNWTPSTDAVGVAKYEVYRGSTANGITTYSLAGTLTTNTITDPGLSAGTPYTYYVKAYDAAGNVSTGLTSAVITTTDSTPPDKSILSSPGNTDTTVSLAWSAVNDNVGVTQYKLFRGATLLATVLPTASLTYTDINLTGSTAYAYTVTAFDAAGNATSSDPLTVTTSAPADTTPPSKPVPAPTNTDTTITLTWPASTDNVGVTQYKVTRGATVLATIASTSPLTFTESGLTASTAYTYTVTAFDAAGNSTSSDPLTVTTNATVDTTPPSKPGTPGLVSSTDTSISLSWTGSTDNVGVTRYDLFRGSTLLTSVGPTDSLTYTDSGLTPSTSYKYSVTAYDAAGNSTTSKSGNLSTAADSSAPSKPGTPTFVGATNSTISVSWTSSTDDVGVTRYDLYRNSVLITSVGPTANLSYTDIGLSVSTSYYYTVLAYDAAGNGTSSDSIQYATTAAPDTTPPSKPVPTPTKTDTTITLTWPASTDNVAVTQYKVTRGATVLATIASTSPLTFTETGLTASTAYTYNVTAFDAAGNSTASDPLTVTTNTPPDITPPSKPVPTSTKTDTSITLTWPAATDNVGVTQYKVTRGATVLATIASTSPLTYTELGLTASTPYTYTVTAFDAAGNSTASDLLTVTTNAPPDTTPPSKAVPTPTKTDVTITLTWPASTDNVGVTQYKITRGATVLATVASTSPLTYTETGLTASTAYTYTVTAFDAAGNSTASDPLTVTTNAAASGPAKLTGTVIGTTGSYANASNTRDKAFDGDTATFFDGPSANGNWVGLDLGSAKQITKISYTPRPPKVSNGVTTTWGNRMVGGKFQLSNNANFLATGSTGGVANVVVDLATISAAPTGTVDITIGNTAAYQFVRYLGPDGSYGDVAEIVFTGMSPVPDTTPPTAPGTPALVSKTSNSITLNWAASTDNVAVTKYEVYRGVTVNSVTTYTLAGTSTTATPFTDTGLAASSSYTYLVKAYDAAGNVTPSLASAVLTTNAAVVPAKLSGTVLGTTGSYGGGTNTRDKAFDNDTTTFFDGPTANGNWVGLDLGSAKTITQISYTPRPPKVANGVTTTWGSRMVGGYFQVSTNANFTNTGAGSLLTIYTITAAPTGTVTVNVSVPAAYQYVRYVAPDGSYGDVGELSFTGY